MLRPNPISTAYPFPLQNKGEGEGVMGKNGIGPKTWMGIIPVESLVLMCATAV